MEGFYSKRDCQFVIQMFSFLDSKEMRFCNLRYFTVLHYPLKRKKPKTLRKHLFLSFAVLKSWVLVEGNPGRGKMIVLFAWASQH